MVKGGENQFGMLTDSPAHFQEKAKIFFHFSNFDYLQIDDLYSIGKSEEEYRKGKKPKKF